MDEIVLRSMLKWPNVPAVYGWLRLDRRGAWLIKTMADRFERIGNPALADFIGRNYAADAGGRWYFQNGPQRVFVAHTGARPLELRAAFLDDAGMLLLQTELGIGVLLDRDLQFVIERMTDERGRSAEQVTQAIMLGTQTRARLLGRTVEMAPIRAAEVPGRFGFDPRPTPRPGEPEC